MITILKNTNIDFQGKRRLAMSLSGLAILLGLVSLVAHGGPNYSIDFKGGLSILLRFTVPEGRPQITEHEVRASLARVDLGTSEVKMSRSAEGEDLMVRVKEEGRFKPPESLIRTALDQRFAERWRLVSDDMLDPDGLPDLQGLSYVAISTDAPADELQSMLTAVGIDNPRTIQHRTIDGEPVLILAGEGRDAVSRIRAALANDYPDYQFDLRSIDRVGPKIGSELRAKAVLAILAALLLIVIYLWWRFELLFGVAAVIALFHDVLITLGVFSVLNLEISVTIIGAFLTLVGYSLNDTIVVFDRIRENLKRYRDRSFPEIINVSINQTLSRTIITGLTTLMVLLVLFLKGGEVLHSFALALLVGIIIGTYSSIYIASPILIEWTEKTGKIPGQRLKKR